MTANTQIPFADGYVLYGGKLNNALGYAPSIQQNKVSVTDSAASTVFTNVAKFVLLKNLGPNTAYLDTSGTATTADIAIEMGDTITLNGGQLGITSVSLICDTAETADVRILSTY